MLYSFRDLWSAVQAYELAVDRDVTFDDNIICISDESGGVFINNPENV